MTLLPCCCVVHGGGDVCMLLLFKKIFKTVSKSQKDLEVEGDDDEEEGKEEFSESVFEKKN